LELDDAHSLLIVTRLWALELKAEVSLGGGPAADRDRRRAVMTLEAFAVERFLPDARGTIHFHAEYEAMLRLRLIPTFGRLRLDEITTVHVAAFRSGMIADGL
jgi:hypothetical protein